MFVFVFMEMRNRPLPWNAFTPILQDKAGQSFRENRTKLQFCRRSEIAGTPSVYPHQEAIVARNEQRSLRGSNPQPLP